MLYISRMKKLKGRYITDCGTVVLNEAGLERIIASKGPFSELKVEKTYETELFDEQLKAHALPGLNFYNADQDRMSNFEWNTPEPFKSLDIEEYVFSLSNAADQDVRIALELTMYNERNLYPLLRHLIFLVDYFRKNNILWGVGRGSSVNSYVLYLIGLHKIDSLKYQLSIDDFLK